VVVAEVRKRLIVNKKSSHRFHMERLNLKKLIEVDGKEHYHVQVHSFGKFELCGGCKWCLENY
jgi:hypothetical protein